LPTSKKPAWKGSGRTYKNKLSSNKHHTLRTKVPKFKHVRTKLEPMSILRPYIPHRRLQRKSYKKSFKKSSVRKTLKK
jgi:hypothetical protein